MIKQALISGIIGLGIIISTPAMAHSYSDNHNHYNNNDFQIILPHNPIRYIQPQQHCVSGHKIDQRQANQHRRIKQGKRSGQLVRWEVKQLRKQQRRIRNAEQRLRNSGHCLTRHEAKKLLHKLNRASNKIRNLKHNNVTRGHRHYNRNHR